MSLQVLKSQSCDYRHDLRHYSNIYSFKILNLLSTFYVSGTVKSAGNIKTNKMSPLPLSILWASGETDLGSKYSVISAVRGNSTM